MNIIQFYFKFIEILCPCCPLNSKDKKIHLCELCASVVIFSDPFYPIWLS